MATTAIGVVTVSGVVLVVTAGAAGVATNGGATAVSVVLVAVAAGAAAATPDAAGVEADGVEEEAAGTLSFTAVAGEGVGGAGVSGMTAVPTAAAVGVDAAQWSAIMVSSLAIKPFSAGPDVGATPKLCPASFTSWPRWILRSTPLDVILTTRPVWSSAMV